MFRRAEVGLKQRVPKSKVQWIVLGLAAAFLALAVWAFVESLAPTMTAVERAQNYRGIVICLVFAAGMYVFSRSRVLQRFVDRVSETPIGIHQRVRDAHDRVEASLRDRGIVTARRSWRLALAMGGTMIGIVPAMMIAAVLSKPDDPELLPNVPVVIRAGAMLVLAVITTIVAAITFRRRTTTLRPGEIHLRPLSGAPKRVVLDGATGRIAITVVQRGVVPFKLGVTLHLKSADTPDLQLFAEHVIGAKVAQPSPVAFKEDDITFWAIEHLGLTAGLLESVASWSKEST